MTTHSSLASVRATRKRLAELGLGTKKSLGQHFLIDDGIVGKIIRLAHLSKESKVVEVGPGIGTLTEALLATGAEVTSVEVDAALWEGLSERYPQLQLIRGDALADTTLTTLVELAPCCLVANLPYSVAATIILEYFQVLPSIQQATVMVQKEVADRIAAEPGTKDYGAYTVKLRLFARVLEQFKVPQQSFYPPPRVASSVIKIARQDLCLDGAGCSHEQLMTASMLADAAFFQRRKTIANSMQAYFTVHQREELAPAELLDAAHIDPRTRGETLPPESYLLLAQHYERLAANQQG